MCGDPGFTVYLSSPPLPAAVLAKRHVRPLNSDTLGQLMNGKIRKKLGIIPQNVTWGGKLILLHHHHMVLTRMKKWVEQIILSHWFIVSSTEEDHLKVCSKPGDKEDVCNIVCSFVNPQDRRRKSLPACLETS